MNSDRGRLYVVATPIGNLADLSSRAREVLAEVAAIAAEDTRHTRRLLTHYGIAAELIAYHEHNEAALTPRLLERLAGGDDLALVSDAGTPLISDPGFVLVRAARQRGIRVVPIPGPSAAITALSAAGLPSDRFLFLGFPPRTAARCRSWLAGLVDEPGTLVFYESGKRAVRTLADLAAVLGGGRRAVVARELTKQFETFLVGELAELAERLAGDAEQRLGELVILVEGASGGDDAAAAREQARVLGILAEALPLKQAAELAARITGGRRNDLYALGLARARGDDGDG
ncbi:putative S-adenosylmethionine-dependent methyltransferase, YraL family [Thioflavicoccus mobilis 8321]|uniref:Ribosomal RNA small subunit methyltransferase I n=1 Tax=Thioflavicoccus mobilis 8321 TaxID=765912 RepID=L0GWQ2_9GAMM|nr:16S rRNA (cytidine(1402)-2'-O)-methyltransferase [Thioflavicoccus mobilis]AGA90257.1 putative S-adenosylmethionine-dependent methyltransferase, YraL family [Thioflavicoccus mobilis 8321]